MKLLINIILYYIIWWSVVLLNNHMSPILLISFVIMIINLNFYLLKMYNLKDSKIFVIVASLGIINDLVISKLGVITFQSNLDLWPFLIWPAFAMTINQSLKNIVLHQYWGIVLGTLFGPLSYYGASQFTLFTYTNNLYLIGLHGLNWLLIMLGLKYLLKKVI